MAFVEQIQKRSQRQVFQQELKSALHSFLTTAVGSELRTGTAFHEAQHRWFFHQDTQRNNLGWSPRRTSKASCSFLRVWHLFREWQTQYMWEAQVDYLSCPYRFSSWHKCNLLTLSRPLAKNNPYSRTIRWWASTLKVLHTYFHVYSNASGCYATLNLDFSGSTTSPKVHVPTLQKLSKICITMKDFIRLESLHRRPDDWWKMMLLRWFYLWHDQ